VVIYLTVLSNWYKPSGAVIEESRVIVGSYSGLVKGIFRSLRGAGEGDSVGSERGITFDRC